MRIQNLHILSNDNLIVKSSLSFTIDFNFDPSPINLDHLNEKIKISDIILGFLTKVKISFFTFILWCLIFLLCWASQYLTYLHSRFDFNFFFSVAFDSILSVILMGPTLLSLCKYYYICNAGNRNIWPIYTYSLILTFRWAHYLFHYICKYVLDMSGPPHAFHVSFDFLSSS